MVIISLHEIFTTTRTVPAVIATIFNRHFIQFALRAWLAKSSSPLGLSPLIPL